MTLHYILFRNTYLSSKNTQKWKKMITPDSGWCLPLGEREGRKERNASDSVHRTGGCDYLSFICQAKWCARSWPLYQAWCLLKYMKVFTVCVIDDSQVSGNLPIRLEVLAYIQNISQKGGRYRLAQSLEKKKEKLWSMITKAISETISRPRPKFWCFHFSDAETDVSG